MRFVMAFVVSFFISPLVFGQGSSEVLWEGSYIGDYAASIPNPNSTLGIISFARNPLVAKEIGLNKEDHEAITKLLRDCGGSLSIISVPARVNGIRLSTLEVDLAIAQKRLKNEEQANDILDPLQIDRLRQVVYQIEIARVGLTEALLHGYLGEHTNIRPDQKPALQILGDSIEAKLANLKERIQIENQSELLNQLTDDQRTIAEELIGKPFDFIEDANSFGNLSRAQIGTYTASIPDPESLPSIVPFIRNKSIAKELKLSRIDQDTIAKTLADLNRQISKSLANAGKRARLDGRQFDREKVRTIEKLFDEVLDPLQSKRLRELVYQVEISRVGFAEALVDGYLGRKIVIIESQKDVLRTKYEKNEANASLALLRVQVAAQEDMFNALDPLQRDAARKLVGKAILFREDLRSESTNPERLR